GMLIVGTIPAAIVGLTIKRHFEWLMRSPLLAGSMLIVTGIGLVILGRLRPREGRYQSMSLIHAFWIGCFQAFAILPGISRSGSTILGARLLGLKNEDSVTFSFLLAIPAICGAVLLELKSFLETSSLGASAPLQSNESELAPFLLSVGAMVSFVVGIVALKWLIGWSRMDRLHWFAWWCIPTGVVAVIMVRSGWM
ncbi:MAG: undecaprenyl-diphosphate phosphatase, partial [Novipirellula sp. JB048]